MGRSGIDISELIKYRDNLRNINQQRAVDTFFKEFLVENAEKVIALAKSRTPVDTGALRASWGIGEANFQERQAVNRAAREGYAGQEIQYQGLGIENVTVEGSNLKIMLFNGMEYASHVEFGHATRSGGWVSGRFMLTVAIDEIAKIMPNSLQTRFAEFLRAKGIGS